MGIIGLILIIIIGVSLFGGGGGSSSGDSDKPKAESLISSEHAGIDATPGQDKGGHWK